MRVQELANKAYSLYLRQSAQEKARLLKIVQSNCTWDGVSALLNIESPSTFLPKGILLQIGSPSKLKDRTFRATFRFPDDGKPQGSKARRVPQYYRNPVTLAQEWQQALWSGGHDTHADFARRQGISRARVTQMLQLLKLPPDALNALAALGDPLPSRIISERTLRSIVHRPEDEQRQAIGRILVESSHVPEQRFDRSE
jgi:hypothetical protein